MHTLSFFSQFPSVPKIIEKLQRIGAQVYIVGGAVRDSLLGLPVVDVDIEVHAVTLEQLRSVLEEYGIVHEVGASFGVLHVEQLPIDWSLPRTDSRGRKPVVTIDPTMTIEQALRRRDLTMNALAYDLQANRIIDPFGGQEDMRDHVLRSPDPAVFVEDPLRFFRVLQFIGRFEMYPDQALTAVCKTMDLREISRERIEAEFEKLFTRSKRPSLALRWLAELGRLPEIMPELAVLTSVPQNPEWHPEGDVFEHTMQVLDAIVQADAPAAHKILRAWVAICHDLGKSVSTIIKDDKIVSYGHEITGVPLARQLLMRFTRNQELINKVLKLVRYHMMPGQLAQPQVTPAAYKRLARALAPDLSLEELAVLADADRRGRNPEKHEPLTTPDLAIERFKQRAHEYAVLEQPEPPLLTGRDFLDVCAPGPQLGTLVKHAYELQINENIADKDELKQRVLADVKISVKK